MKKLFLSLSLLLAVTVGFSQVAFKPSLGISFNDFSSNSSGEFKGKVGVQLGGSVAIGKKFYVEPGIFYATKSSEFSYLNSQNTSIAVDAVIKGIRVPLALGVDVIGNTKSLVNIRIFGGGSGFFMTGVSDDLVKDNFSSPTWGTFAGVGTDILMFFADISYEWSLTNATKDISNIEFGKSRTLFVTVGFRF